MSQAQTVINIASGEVGYREGFSSGHWNNQQKYSPAVHGLEWSQGQAWCHTFVSWVFQQAGIKNLAPVTASCLEGVQWFKSNGRWSQYPAVGAVIYFGVGGGSHVGIVTSYDDTRVFTVEGNTNASGSPEGDGVYRKVHVRQDAHVYGYGYPQYAEGISSADPAYKNAPHSHTPVPPMKDIPFISFRQVRWASQAPVDDQRHVAPGPDNPRDDVQNVQEALRNATGLGADAQLGLFDAPTHQAYAAWQRSLGYSGIDADGIPGVKSLNRLGLQTGRFQVRETEGTYTPTFTPDVSSPPATHPPQFPASPSRPWIWASVGRDESRAIPGSVRIVQDALKKEFPPAEWAEEHGSFWGPRTQTGYSWWQRKLGYNGADADGRPGKDSLTKLASKYNFDIHGEFPVTSNGRILPGQIDFSGKGQWSSGRPACEGYIREALRIMNLPTTYWLPGMLTIAERETAYNSPRWQINTTDSNARNVPDLFGGRNAPDGHPAMCSRGMIQAIPQTFARYHQSGTSFKIYDPVASAAAGINYIIHAYNVAPNGFDLTQKVQQADPRRPPKGYFL